MTDRKLSAILSDEAYRGWQDFCGEHGVTMSALAEALGRELASEAGPRPSRHLDQLLKNARRIAADRMRRGR